MSDNCSPCTDCTIPTTGALCPEPATYTANTCPDPQPSDCVYYTGLDNPCLGIFGSTDVKRVTLTSIFKTLFTYLSTLLSRITSTSLSVHSSGLCSDQISIELIPSAQVGNILILGNDGKPYVPPTIVSMGASKCISWQMAVSGNTTTWVPVIDFACVSNNITPDAIDCVAPTNVNISSITQNSAIITFDVVGGVTYDLLLNNQVNATNITPPYTLTALTPNTNYSIALRINCGSGSSSETVVTFATLPIISCTPPTNLQITGI